MDNIMETIIFAVKDVSNIFCWIFFREIVNSKHIFLDNIEKKVTWKC